MHMRIIIRTIDQGEPAGLSKAAYIRIRDLKAMNADQDGFPGKQDIPAILESYRAGSLHVEEGMVTY